MSLKNGHRGQGRWSLTARLTVWYSLLAIALLATVTAYSYWMLTSNLEREDDEFLASRLQELGQRLKSEAEGLSSLIQAWDSPSTQTSPLHIVVRAVNNDGEIVAAMRGSDTVPWPALEDSASLKTKGWRYGSQTVKLATGETLTLQAAFDRRHEAAFLARYRKQLYLVIFVAALTCAVGGTVLVHRGLSPLRELSSVVAGIGANQMGERLDPANYAAELEQFATTFNGMLDRLQSAFDRLSRFSGDIAHELRTPLHNLRGEIEVALNKSRSGEEYRDTLGSCLEETSRLSRLVDSLLFLARSDQPQSALARQQLRLADELTTIQEFYEAAAEEAGITLSVTCLTEQCFVDRILFQRAIGNLVTNALTHTPSGGRIAMHATRLEAGIAVSVSDTGSGIAAEQLPYVFDRLYRGTGLGSDSVGCGLGLSIVESIVELHGGTVQIHSTVGQGTTVETWWPMVGNDANGVDR